MQQEFQCKGCSFNFHVDDRKPRVLVPCGHSVCEICTEKFSHSKCLECDSQVETNIPNYELIKLMNSRSISPSAPPSYPEATNETSPLQLNEYNIQSETPDSNAPRFSASKFCSSLSTQFFKLSFKRKSNYSVNKIFIFK